MAKNNPKILVIHHTGGTDLDPLADTSHHTFEIVNDYHKSLGWGKIGYHYFIEKNGKVTQGRKDDEEGAHTIGQNLTSIGICLAGNFDATMPTEAQKTALTALLKQKMAQYSIPASLIVPHRHFAKKTCFGKHLSDRWAQDLVAPVNPVPVPTPANDAIKDEIRTHITAIETLLGKIK